jgi:putative ABC transport system permease protein
LAIGARPVDILTQFLLEAIVLAFVGGVAGLALGVLMGQIVGKVTDYNVSLQPTSALVAVAISCGIGIVFGFFPARHASSLDPIQALRHE